MDLYISDGSQIFICIYLQVSFFLINFVANGKSFDVLH